MQKVYLLLRNNKQTGPYSLEELLHLNLKPFDLVWVDGRSAAWQYPFEIPALKPYVPETPHAEVPFQPVATAAMEENPVVTTASAQQPQSPIPQNPVSKNTEAPKRVFVSIPKTYTAAKEQKTYATNSEQQPRYEAAKLGQHKAYMPPVDEPVSGRTESINTANPSFAKPSQKAVAEDLVSTNYSRSLNDVEEDYSKWVYRQKTKKKTSVSAKDLALAVLVLAVIGSAYYIMSKPSVTNAIVPGNKTVTPVVEPTEQVADENNPKEILSPELRVTSPGSDNVSAPAENKQPKNTKTKNHNSSSKAQTVSSVPQVQNPIPVEKTTPNIHESNNEVAASQPQVKQQPQETTEKKKKLGEVLKGIFAKKEKKEEPKSQAPVSEDPRPATNRQASRRDGAAEADEKKNNTTEISSADLAQQVDLSSNAPDNWMLGVKNLKVTLHNRSNATIQTASVMVSYFNENNELLDKKLIYFSNIAPKGRATVAAPDSKFADHVEYKLTSIAGKEDRFASN